MSPNILKPKTSQAKSKPAKKVHKAEKQKTLKEMNADALSGAVPTEDVTLNAELAEEERLQEGGDGTEYRLGDELTATDRDEASEGARVVELKMQEGPGLDARLDEIDQLLKNRAARQLNRPDTIAAIELQRKKNDARRERIKELKSAIDKQRRLAFKPRFKAELEALKDELEPKLARLLALVALTDSTPASMLSIEAVLKRRLADGRLKRNAIQIESELKQEMRGEI